MALEHLRAIAAAADVSVSNDRHRAYLHFLRGIIIFIWERKPVFIQLLLCELRKFWWGLYLLLFILFDRRFLC